MTIALVRSVQAAGASGATTVAADFTGSTLLVAVTTQGASTVTTFTDSSGNTWTLCGTTASSANTLTQIYYKANPTVSASQTFSFAGTLSAFQVYGFSGTAGGVVAQAVGATGTTGATIQPGSLTPASNGYLLVSGFSAADASGTVSINSSFIGLLQENQSGGVNFEGAAAYLIQATAAAVNPTWTMAGGTPAASGALMASFAPALTAAVSDTTATSDSLTPIMKAPAAPTDSVATSDSLTPIMKAPAAPTDSVATSDSLTPIMAATAALTDTTATSDSLTPAALMRPTLMDTTVTSDSYTTTLIGVLPAVLADVVATSDSLSATIMNGPTPTPMPTPTVTPATPFNIPSPTWPTPSPGYQYEFSQSPFNVPPTLVKVAAQENPTQAVPPLPPVPDTDTGGPP